ncbi:hypothetical protein TTHERM_00300650 (macronuclear) [Tetrahymena thermophila SB210]|uniref:Kinase domain protein n=1 Tax=Tetrahymena thermophila (strain SB210) TaxID=312017 RepID=I7M3V1_TETTS|nr:hypothetical protein TTHERM_00300650 [Tetrahymena thermophila SB210]EAS04347.2 hypothetical protein TTHERM_00300650 [Tetrahymena thermophila SB210]|eukprot:XP_001024592.2 hypothetical protein TTHERM_00300650 [Tetrahymena thermophila SB210]
MGICGSKPKKNKENRRKSYQVSEISQIKQIQSLQQAISKKPIKCLKHQSEKCQLNYINLQNFSLLCDEDIKKDVFNQNQTMKLDDFLKKLCEDAQDFINNPSKQNENNLKNEQIEVKLIEKLTSLQSNGIAQSISNIERLVIKFESVANKFDEEISIIFRGLSNKTKQEIKDILQQNCQIYPKFFKIKKELIEYYDLYLTLYQMISMKVQDCLRTVEEFKLTLDVFSQQDDSILFSSEEITYETATQEMNKMLKNIGLQLDQGQYQRPKCQQHTACFLERMDIRNFRIFCSNDNKNDLQTPLDIILKQLFNREIHGRINYFQELKEKLNQFIAKIKSSVQLKYYNVVNSLSKQNEEEQNIKLLESIISILEDLRKQKKQKVNENMLAEAIQDKIIFQNNKFYLKKRFINLKKLQTLIYFGEFLTETIQNSYNYLESLEQKSLNAQNSNQYNLFLQKNVNQQNLQEFISQIQSSKYSVQQLILDLVKIDYRQIFDQLTQINSIQILSLKPNNCGKEGATKLSNYLSNLKYLKSLSLDFKNDQIGAEGLFEVSNTFQNLGKSLEILKLNLEENKLKQCGFLAEKLQFLNNLTSLSIKLGLNLFVKSQIVEILYSIKDLYKLRNLELDFQNQKVDEMCFRVFSESLENKQLLKLSLNLNNSQLKMSELKQWNVDQLKDIQELNLNLSNNSILDNDLQSFFLAISQLKNIQILSLHLDNVLSNELKADYQCTYPQGLSEILKNAAHLKELELSLGANKIEINQITQISVCLKQLTQIRKLKLYLWNNGLNEQGLSVLIKNIKPLVNLQCLHLDFQWNQLKQLNNLQYIFNTNLSSCLEDLYLNFSNNELANNEALQLIQQLGSLQYLNKLNLDFSSNKLYYSSISQLLQLLDKNSDQLEEISFSARDNILTNTENEVYLPSKYFKKLKYISLDLGNTFCEDQMIILIKNLLQNCYGAEVETIKLNMEQIKVNGEKNLFEMIGSLQLFEDLRYLSLNLNKIKSIQNLFVEKIVSSIPHHKLKQLHLQLSDIELSDRIESLVLELVTTQKDLNSLTLDIWKNKIFDRTFENIIDTLTNKTENNIIEFNINAWDNQLSEQLQKQIAKKLQNLQQLRGFCQF